MVRPVNLLRQSFVQVVLLLSMLGFVSVDRILKLALHPLEPGAANPSSGLLISSSVANIYLMYAYGLVALALNFRGAVLQGAKWVQVAISTVVACLLMGVYGLLLAFLRP